MSLSPVLLAVMLLLLMVVVIIISWWKRRQQTVPPGFKAVLMTGCDRGFGHMLAKRLDGEGFKVFAGCLDAQGEGAKRLESETSSKLELLQLDVTNEDQIEEALATITDLLMGHTLWAVVNNAGVASHAEFEWYPKTAFRGLMDINFTGVVNVTRAFLPLIRASRGRVINVASMAGRTALPGYTAYSASKFAVIGFSESLRREMAHFGVKVITMEPALYKTDLACVDTVLEENEKFWSTAAPGVKRDYGVTYFADTQMARRRLLSWSNKNVGEVIDRLTDAVSARHPRCRYVTPSCLCLLNDMMNVLLASLQDFVIDVIMGISSKPDMLSPHLLNNCRMGRRRSHAT